MRYDIDKKKLQGFLARAGGLLGVAVVALMLAACGLTMAFGLYDISKQLFIAVVVALILILVISRRK